MPRLIRNRLGTHFRLFQVCVDYAKVWRWDWCGCVLVYNGLEAQERAHEPAHVRRHCHADDRRPPIVTVAFCRLAESCISQRPMYFTMNKVWAHTWSCIYIEQGANSRSLHFTMTKVWEHTLFYILRWTRCAIALCLVSYNKWSVSSHLVLHPTSNKMWDHTLSCAFQCARREILMFFVS